MLSRMSLFTCQFALLRMDWLSHLCFLTHEPFPMNLLSHVRIHSLTYVYSDIGLSTYESTFSRMDWLFHLCFLTLEPMHPWIYLLTYLLTLWLMLSHAWAFHLWIYFLTYGLTLSALLCHARAFWPMNLPSHIWIDSLSSAFSRMSLLTYESTFSRMEWLPHLCFLKHEPFHLWI